MNRQVALVFHAHLPHLRGGPELSWLFENVRDVYLPLLDLLEANLRRGHGQRFSLSVSPTLLGMLDDPELREACATFIAQSFGALSAAADTAPEAVAFLKKTFADRLRRFRVLGGDLPGVLSLLAHSETVELFTCAATHALLPLLQASPEQAWAQIRLGRDAFEQRFGHRPRAFWLPECGYAPFLEPLLLADGVRMVVVEDALPQEPSRVLTTTQGLTLFPRHRALSARVWSAESGFPGDANYLDFHHRSHGQRVLRVTGSAGAKASWTPEAAQRSAEAHAVAFLDALEAGPASACVLPFDAELFGHHWYEGLWFLEALFARAHERGTVDFVSLGDLHSSSAGAPTVQFPTSTWGAAGDLHVWVDESNAWRLPLLDRAQRGVRELVERTGATPVSRQAARELLLAQASDWPFLLSRHAAMGEATRRLELHLGRCFSLLEAESAGGAGADLAAMETEDNVFRQIDVEVYRSNSWVRA